MKIFGAFIIAGILLIPFFYLAFWVGNRTGKARATSAEIRRLGFTQQSAERYTRAMRLLNRMVRITQLDGEFAKDILSEETRQEIETIVNEYRKDVEAA